MLAGDAPQLVIAHAVAAMEVADAVGAMISRAQPGRPLARRPAHAVAGPDRQRPGLAGGEAGRIAAARATRQLAADTAAAAGRDDLVTAAFAAWTEPTPWQTRPYGVVDERAVAVQLCADAMLAHIEGRFDEARHHYAEAAAQMRRNGSLHADGFHGLARLTIELSAFLGRPEAAARHFATAELLARRWNSPHWTARARAAAGRCPPNG